MNQESKNAGASPAVNVSTESTKYETGKGCLVFVLIGVVLAGMTAGVIVLLSDPTAVVAMG
jgi:hypothetical protein|tara:strand:+ start:12796 stop:12978 length:183 start_codon:yes stop_codon:yes gene_type:complete